VAELVYILQKTYVHQEPVLSVEDIKLPKKYFSRNFLFGILVFASLIFIHSTVFAGESPNCSGIAKAKIEETIRKLNAPSAKVLSVKQSPVDGICEIAVQDQGGIHVIYSDRLLNYLLLGSLVETKSMSNLTAQATQKIQDQKRVDLSKISLSEALVMGDKNANKKVIIFSDPD
jgi:thiol:disulfide interchange protein DsbC